MGFIRKNKGLAVFLIFLVVGLALYANSFGNRFFWDDDDLIVNNVYVHDFNVGKFFSANEIAGVGQVSNYWRPLTLISLAVDYKLWGGSHPLGFHLTNTLLHVLAAWLVFVLLSKLLPLRKGSLADVKIFWLAFLPSLLFLIHPLQTEAVVYTAGRADPLSAVCLLSSLWFYVSFRLDKKWWQYAAALLFFGLGILSKEQSVLLPALVLLIEAVFFVKERGQGGILKALKYSASFILLAAAYLVLRLVFLNFNDILKGPEYDLSQVYNQSVWSRLFTFCLVMLAYFQLLFVPTGLHMAREVAPVSSLFSWPVASFLALSAGLIYLSIKTWRANRLIAFGLLWFLVILLPRTNILKINRPMYEHWLYLPMIGFWLALFALLFLLYEKIGSAKAQKILKAAGATLFVVCFVFFASLTVFRNTDWRDPITFYEKNLKYTPNSYVQKNNLAMAYADVGRYQEAIGQYRESLAIADIYPQVHYNLGNALAAAGQIDEAVAEYRLAIDASPSFFNPYVNLISVLSDKGRKDEAQEVLKKAEGVFADSVNFWYLKGVVYFQWQEYDAALAALKRAQALSPEDESVRAGITAVSAKIKK